jgi:CHAT domain-containing protein
MVGNAALICNPKVAASLRICVKVPTRSLRLIKELVHALEADQRQLVNNCVHKVACRGSLIFALAAFASILSACNTIWWASLPGRAMSAKMEDQCAAEHPCVWLVVVDKEVKLATRSREMEGEGNYEEANTLLREQIALYDKTVGHIYPYVALDLSGIGWDYMREGRNVEAEQAYVEAIDIDEKSLPPNHPSLASILDNLASTYYQEGRYEEAAKLYSRALKIHRANIGAARESWHVLADVLHLYQAPFGDYSQYASVISDLNLLGATYDGEKRYTEAEECYRQALGVVKESNWFSELWGRSSNPVANVEFLESQYGFALGNLATDYMRDQRFADAEKLYLEQLEVDRKAPDPYDSNVAVALDDLARVCREQKKYSDSERYLRESIEIWKKTPKYSLQQAWAYASLGATLAAQGRIKEADTAYEKWRPTLLQSNNELSDDDAREVRAYIALQARVAREPSLDPAASDSQAKAFSVVELLREGDSQGALDKAGARAAADNPSTAMMARTLQDVEDQQSATRRTYDTEYAKPEGERSQTLLAELDRKMTELDQQEKTSKVELRKALPSYGELIAPHPILEAGAGSMLRPGEAFASYFTLDDRVLVWVIHPERNRYYDVPVEKRQLSAMITRVRESIGRDGRELRAFDVADAYALNKLLIGPIAAELHGITNLIVVPDDTILPVPFGALISDPAGAEYEALAADYRDGLSPSPEELVDDYPRIAWLAKRDFSISELPAVTSMRALRLEEWQRTAHFAFAKTTTEPFIGIGDPLLGADHPKASVTMIATRGGETVDDIRKLPSLPGTRNELLAEARALGADPRRAVFVEEFATRASVISLNRDRLRHAKVIAFATHALIGGQLEGLKEPALVLTPPPKPSDDDNGLFDLDDVLDLKLNDNDWVILSACNTFAPGGSGEGFSGLTRAFFFAGAPSLLVSQWSVDDLATEQLMTNVLSAYAANRWASRSGALRAGMLKLMSSDARGEHAYFAHPFAWAPFFVVGEGGTPLR